jgi:hypothetical protein
MNWATDYLINRPESFHNRQHFDPIAYPIILTRATNFDTCKYSTPTLTLEAHRLLDQINNYPESFASRSVPSTYIRDIPEAAL